MPVQCRQSKHRWGRGAQRRPARMIPVIPGKQQVQSVTGCTQLNLHVGCTPAALRRRRTSQKAEAKCRLLPGSIRSGRKSRIIISSLRLLESNLKSHRIQPRRVIFPPRAAWSLLFERSGEQKYFVMRNVLGCRSIFGGWIFLRVSALPPPRGLLWMKGHCTVVITLFYLQPAVRQPHWGEVHSS